MESAGRRLFVRFKTLLYIEFAGVVQFEALLFPRDQVGLSSGQDLGGQNA